MVWFSPMKGVEDHEEHLEEVVKRDVKGNNSLRICFLIVPNGIM